ncbi:MAG: winged helix-turn-helix transcriptional regulator [Thaumarchaeota archaeon]|nr:winged helix-turn-helix transcriptional regulator [Nitrososphaerota archaeon]
MPSIEPIASSRVRLTVALLLTVRPRTLTELAESTGVSIQAVLKHTKKLEEEGLLASTILGAGRYVRRRKLYSMKKRVEGASSETMLVAAFAPSDRERPDAEATEEPYSEYLVLERFAEDVVFSRANLRESLKRLERAISRLAESQDTLTRAIVGRRSLTSEEKHIAYLYFTEDSESRVKDVLKTHFGCADPKAALTDVLTKLGGK